MPNTRLGGRFPVGLIGALALIVGFECHIERNAIDYQGGNHWSYKVSTAVAASGAKGARVLCFGDSLLRLGVAPSVIEAETGLSGYNFAQTGGQAPGSYFLLKKALKSGVRPSAIVVDFFPRLLAEDPGFNNDNWPFVADLSDAFGFASIKHNPSTFAWIAVRLVLPSARSRHSFRTNVLLKLHPQLVSIPHEIMKSIRNWKINQGAEIVLSRPGLVENLDLWEQGYFSKFRCSRINRFYVDRFLKLASDHQIPVFWLLPPYQEALQERCDRSGFDSRHMAFVRDFQESYPNLRVLDARRSGYPSEVFHDLHHLGREGASVLSSDIGREIRRHLAGNGPRNRWISLEQFRPRPEAAPLEDVEQSRVVIRKEFQAGRGGLDYLLR